MSFRVLYKGFGKQWSYRKGITNHCTGFYSTALRKNSVFSVMLQKHTIHPKLFDIIGNIVTILSFLSNRGGIDEPSY